MKRVLDHSQKIKCHKVKETDVDRKGVKFKGV